MTISVSNLGKRFNREWIFQGLTQEFTSGNIYAITGANGSGKSTLMQVLWGQVPASEGTVEYRINDTLIPVEEAFRHIAIATPYMDLLEEFTLKEHLEFHFRFKQNKLGGRVDELIEKLELQQATHKPIKQFSSGMRQRVKLGIALFSTSQAVFLDEPTTNLDENATAWYTQNLAQVAMEKVIFIATNQANDYPNHSHVLNLSTLKRVTPAHKVGIHSS
jgi:ABC-type multidrug transport system ATPase subunit